MKPSRRSFLFGAAALAITTTARIKQAISRETVGWIIKVDGPPEDTYPLGTLTQTLGRDLPKGWLPCDGRAISRKFFGPLYGVIGNSYGEADGLFKIPDLRGSVVTRFDAPERESGHIKASIYYRQEDLTEGYEP